jgi:cell division septum initiation protein DivIVA
MSTPIPPKVTIERRLPCSFEVRFCPMQFVTELENVIQDIRDARPVPFSASAVINRKEVLDRLERLYESMPEDLRKANWVMKDRDEVLTRIQQEAQELLAQAREERERLVARTEIVLHANREADKIIEDAKLRAREIRMEAEDYVDAKLASFEVVLQKTLAAVVKGRESLQGRLEMSVRLDDELLPEPEQAASMAGSGRGRRRWPAS